jgi:hypothetical protein
MERSRPVGQTDPLFTFSPADIFAGVEPTVHSLINRGREAADGIRESIQEGATQ